MLNIIETSRNFSKVEEYLLTVSPATVSIKDIADGEVIPVDGYMIYEKDTNDGLTEILSIITPDKQVYACQSQTFKRSFREITEIIGTDTAFSVIKVSGKSKKRGDGNTTFINCILDVNSVS